MIREWIFSSLEVAWSWESTRSIITNRSSGKRPWTLWHYVFGRSLAAESARGKNSPVILASSSFATRHTNPNLRCQLFAIILPKAREYSGFRDLQNHPSFLLASVHCIRNNTTHSVQSHSLVSASSNSACLNQTPRHAGPNVIVLCRENVTSDPKKYLHFFFYNHKPSSKLPA